MSKMPLKILLLIGLMMVAISCAPDTSVPATLAVTRVAVVMVTNTVVSSPTPTTTPTVIISPTPETTPTAAATNLPVIVLTNTPRPTFTPHPTPTPIFYDLPAWVNNPDMNILLVGSTRDDGTITLFNADTGQQFEIYVDVRDLSPTWLWQEGNHFLSPTTPRASQPVINIETGELISLSHFNQDKISPNGRYAAHMTRLENSSEIVIITDQETGLETTLNNPFLDLSRDDYEMFADTHWSSDGALLAVLYRKWYDDDHNDSDLAVYTPSGELFRQYGNVDTMWNNSWSPTLPYKILYADGHNYSSNMPCILDIITNQRTCLETVAEWVENKKVWLHTFFIWSSDGSKISFGHLSQEENGNNLGI